MAKENPFTLIFGKPPTEYVARLDEASVIKDTFNSDTPLSQAYLIEGVRGSGKTVLMTAITRDLENEGWIIVDLNSTQNLMTDLSVRLAEKCSKNNLKPSGINLSFAGFGVSVPLSQTHQESVGVIEKLLDSIKKKNKKLLITIDEVMHDDNMRSFASEFQLLLRKDYPIYLIMTGLYDVIYSIQNDPALTFLLRTPKLNIGPLSIFQITTLYEKALKIDFDKANYLAKFTKGYAFAFQALGRLFYDSKEKELDKILSELDIMLDEYVYRKIWESLSKKEREIIQAIGDSQKKVSDICEIVGIKSSSFSKYRERLIKKGILNSPDHGYLEIYLPRFSHITRAY